MLMPRVSIGMPVYNAATFIREAIDSILAQSYQDFELIITDNASTDETQAICTAYAAQDDRVRYHRNSENIGANSNFNFVFTLARGEYFKWAAHDDVLAQTYLERCVAALDADPNVVLAHSETRLIDNNGNELTIPEGKNYVKDAEGKVIFVGRDSKERKLSSQRAHERFAGVLRTGWCYEVFGVIRRDALSQTPLLRPFYGADKVLLAELGAMGLFAMIDEELFYNRRHPEQSRSHSVEDRAKWTKASIGKLSKVNDNLRKSSAYMRVAFMGSMPLDERLRVLGLAVRYNTYKLGCELGLIKEKGIVR